MAKATVEFVGEESVTKLIAKMNSAMDDLKRKNSELSAATHDHHADATKHLQAHITEVAKLAGTYLTAEKALEAFNQELEHKRELERESADTQKETAGAEMGLRRNLGGLPPVQIEALIREMKENAHAADVSPAAMYRAYPQTAAMNRRQSPTEVGATLATAARVAPDDIGSTAEAIAQVGGMRKTNDPMSNLGFMATMSQQSGASWDDMKTSMIASMKTMTEYRNKPEDAAALVDAIAAEVQGGQGPRKVRAISGELAQKLAEAYPKSGSSTAELIEQLQNNPAKAKSFLRRNKFSPEGQPIIEQLLQGGEAGSLYQKFRSQFAQAGDYAQRGKSFMESVRGGEFEGVATSERSYGTLEHALTTTGEARHRAFVHEAEQAADEYAKFNRGMLTRMLRGPAYGFNEFFGGDRGEQAMAELRSDRSSEYKKVLGGGSDEVLQKLDRQIELLEKLARPEPSRPLNPSANIE